MKRGRGHTSTKVEGRTIAVAVRSSEAAEKRAENCMMNCLQNELVTL